VCGAGTRDGPHFGDDQDFQESGSVADVSGNDEERFGDERMVLGERVESIADSMKLLNFLKKSGCIHDAPDVAKA